VNSTCHDDEWACCRAPQLSEQKQRQQDSVDLSRAGVPTVDDAGDEVRLVGGPRGRQSMRRVVDSASGLFSFVCYSTILTLFM